MEKIHLPRDVRFIMNRLAENGHRADIVGGSVRDAILGREIGDYDITTDATPERTAALFSDFRTVETGIKHGTLTVVIGKTPYEITTYRQDGEYLDNRHPSSVNFTRELSLDLSRRDFTVNAMCYNERDGLSDLFDGRGDLERRLIRTVGEPERRFSEDALRILRALRFASVLDFEIEENTARAVRECAHLLENVSRERIYTEWIKLLSGKGAHRILSEFSDIADYISPGLSNMSLPSEERFAIASPRARMLSLYLWGKEDAASDFSASMLYLRSDKHIRTLGVAVLTQIFDATLSTLPEAQRLLYKIGEEAALLTAELGALIGKWDSGALRLVREALELGLPYRISDLEIGGRELIALGFSGERVGDMLDRLLLAVIDGEVENSKEALLSYAVT